LVMMRLKEKNFATAVLYVHNNETVIGEFIEKVHHQLCENFEKFEIICVNDYCTDRSVEIIKEFAACLERSVISVIHMSYYQGVEAAMNAGIDLAIGDFVFEFDTAVMDYKEELIMQVYQRALKGFDIVSAAPKKMSKTSSKMFYTVFNKVFHTPYHLRTEVFRVLSRRAINRVHSMSITIPYRKAVYANCGLKMDQIIYDNTGKSVYEKSKQVNELRKDMAINSLLLFTDVGYKISMFLSAVMMLFTIISGVYTIIIFLGASKPVEGWTTTMAFLSFAFFGVFALFTIMIKYLSILLELVFKKQKYVIESIEKITK
jgi:glycosyltransferase involved in cell wall biosynthesis